MLGEGRKDRRGDSWAGQASDRVDVILRRQRARASVRKVWNRELVGERLPGHREIDITTLCVARKGRVRGKEDIRSNPDVVHAFCDGRRGRVGRQRIAARIDELRWRHLHRSPRHELVGTLQVVIPVQRLVDVVGVWRLVRRIGPRRIQVFGRALRERGVERVVALSARRIGAVDGRIKPLRPTTREQPERQCGDEPAPY